MALALLGNTRICLLRESERLFVSLKMSCVCHDCSRLTPPPWLSPLEWKMSMGSVKAGPLSIGHTDSYLEVRQPRKEAITRQGWPAVYLVLCTKKGSQKRIIHEKNKKNKLSKQLEQEWNHRNGDHVEGYRWWGGKVQRISSINGR